MRLAKAVLIGVVVTTLALFFYFNYIHRPKYIFVNLTADHRHDLALMTSLKIAEQRAGIENALVMLESLPPKTTIQDAAHRIFQKLRIGERTGGKGILYLYSQQDNLFKIEVSYALEGLIPDVVCYHLEQAAQSYMLSDVPEDFLVELMVTLNIHGKDMGAESERAWGAPEWVRNFYLSGGAGVRSELFNRSYADYRHAILNLSAEALDVYQPSTDPGETVESYLESLRQGVGEPGLPLLTEGSRIFRVIVPRSPAQQHRILKYYQKALPYKLFVRDGLALAVFRSGTPNLPIVLRRLKDGLWRVDEPKAWTWFDRYENGNDFVVKSQDMPFMPDLMAIQHPGALACKFGTRLLNPPLMDDAQGLDAAMAQREAAVRNDPKNAGAYARLGEAYFCELGFVTKALGAYEEASRLDPGNAYYRWRLVDITIYAREYDKFLYQLWELAYGMRLRQLLSFSRVGPEDKVAVQWFWWYRRFMIPKLGEFRAMSYHEII